ncbi:MAG TPA: SRPBCC family protein [Longimicrobium sp.]|nr:SRPBCC family protein [Longimicrobium sp.]
MKLYELRREQRLAVGIREAWDFFSHPANLAAITPPEMRFEVTGQVPEHIRPGLIVTYRVRPLLGVPVRWVTEITHVREPELFVDEQRFGPYRFWHHQHLFREVPGGVEVQDIVHYALPRGAGPVGRGVVRARLEAIFDHRRAVLERKYGALPDPTA